MTDNLGRAQRAALDGLVERGVISQEQLRAVLGALDTGQRATSHGRVWEVLGYVGGALVVAGATLLVWTRWSDLSHDARVTLLATATVLLLGAGAFIGGGPRGLRTRAKAPTSARTRSVLTLHVFASITAAMTVGTAVDVTPYFNSSLAGFVVALAGYAVFPSVPGMLATAIFSIGAVLAATGEWLSSGQLAIAASLAVLGALWVAVAALGLLVDTATGLAVGTLIALSGAQWAVTSDQPWYGYAGTALIAVLCFAGSLYRGDVLVAPGVLGITLAVPEAVWDWTGASLGGPLTVLLCGVTFLVAAAIGLRLRRRSPARQ